MTKPRGGVGAIGHTDQCKVALSAVLMRLPVKADTRGFKEGFEEGWEAAKAELRGEVVEARRLWIAELDPADYGDCDVVTPFDHFLLHGSRPGSAIQMAVVRWADRTFGPDRENAAWKKLFEEVGEVLKNPSEQGEWGDVFILLYDLANMYGIDPDRAVIQKLEDMRGREWYTTVTGTKQHIKEEDHVRTE